MIRPLFAAAIAIAFGSSLFAAEPGRFCAKVDFEFRGGESTFEVKTSVSGPLDRREKVSVGEIKSVHSRKGEPAQETTVRVEVTFEPMLIEKAWFVVASFRVTEKRNDGKERVLSEPTIITAIGRSASLFTGDPNGDHVKVEFTPELVK